VKAVRKSVIGFTGLTDVLHCLSTDGARELLDAPTLSLCRTLLQTPPGASATPNERSDETLGELVWATRCLGFFQQIHAPEAHAALMRGAKLRTFAPGSVICRWVSCHSSAVTCAPPGARTCAWFRGAPPAPRGVLPRQKESTSLPRGTDSMPIGE
jgi:hypothetical protein